MNFNNLRILGELPVRHNFRGVKLLVTVKAYLFNLCFNWPQSLHLNGLSLKTSLKQFSIFSLLIDYQLWIYLMHNKWATNLQQSLRRFTSNANGFFAVPSLFLWFKVYNYNSETDKGVRNFQGNYKVVNIFE